MPGLKSATVARCPFTLISVNCVITKVLVTLSSLTVIAFPLTFEIRVGWGGGVVFFLLPPPKAEVVVIIAIKAETTSKAESDFLIAFA
ncbi:MAG: hypothetical protein DME49_03860 [Verrucomicrobia bacterium]|nr:MAG: hypothetical protein DME49_03860 [Verrucomicrobiota bacterium]PYL40896.1 MAG: hypothetical protein DMF34_00050 [Verrucomicrobiota bacterium]